MRLAKVVGNVVSTIKDKGYYGYKLMLVEVIGGGSNEGERLVAIDTISAGIGDRVLVTLGSSARRMVEDDTIPVDAAIVGIIDEDCEF